jgi:hypothetical protein
MRGNGRRAGARRWGEGLTRQDRPDFSGLVEEVNLKLDRGDHKHGFER